MIASREILTIALPKGTLYKSSVTLLEKAGFNCSQLRRDSRQLLFTEEKDGVRYVICRPTDIPTFVEYGAADLGLVGKDTLVEQRKDVYELLDLKYGFCRFMVAVPKGKEHLGLENRNQARVATKFPRVAEDYFRGRGLQVEVIKLHGNIELAPIVGLAEMIVDIVSTGRTLKENNLVEVAEVMRSTTRLIANPVSQQLKAGRINPLVEQLAGIVEEGGWEA